MWCWLICTADPIRTLVSRTRASSLASIYWATVHGKESNQFPFKWTRIIQQLLLHWAPCAACFLALQLASCPNDPWPHRPQQPHVRRNSTGFTGPSASEPLHTHRPVFWLYFCLPNFHSLISLSFVPLCLL